MCAEASSSTRCQISTAIGIEHASPFREDDAHRAAQQLMQRSFPGNHATRLPSRNVARGTGKRSDMATRTKSALRPRAIAPRSVKPAALAGADDIVRIACGNDHPTLSTSSNVAVSKLDGT